MRPESVQQLRTHVRGEVIEPADPGYETARKVYNGMIDKRPALIARCVDVHDVIHSVRFAREENLLVAVRGGSHNAGGLGTCDGGLVIDLSRMRGVRVDPEARIAYVAGGATWGDVDHATNAFGLATPAGVISTTGVAGLTLGGGIGHLTRKYGLTVDNLLGADMVLADGSFVTVGPGKHEDLYWAIRGGGGNFGVVTSFTFRLHPVGTVIAGPTLWPLERAAEAMQFYREFLPKAPEDLNGFFAFLKVPPAPPFPPELHLQNMCGVVWCWAGAHENFDAAFRPVREKCKPSFEHVGPVPHPILQSLFDPLYPPGLQQYWRADYFKSLSDDVVRTHIRHGSTVPTMQSTMHMYPIDGAVHRVREGETAFACRDAQWAEVIVGVDPDPANAGLITRWCRDYWDATHPYSSGGAYVNFMMEEGQERVMATYRSNYARLASIKRRYDPDNFFRVNQNIRPAATGVAGA